MLVVTRNEAIGVLDNVVVAPVTSTSRTILTCLPLGSEAPRPEATVSTQRSRCGLDGLHGLASEGGEDFGHHLDGHVALGRAGAGAEMGGVHHPRVADQGMIDGRRLLVIDVEA